MYSRWKLQKKVSNCFLIEFQTLATVLLNESIYNKLSELIPAISLDISLIYFLLRELCPAQFFHTCLCVEMYCDETMQWDIRLL